MLPQEIAKIYNVSLMTVYRKDKFMDQIPSSKIADFTPESAERVFGGSTPFMNVKQICSTYKLSKKQFKIIRDELTPAPAPNHTARVYLIDNIETILNKHKDDLQAMQKSQKESNNMSLESRVTKLESQVSKLHTVLKSILERLEH